MDNNTRSVTPINCPHCKGEILVGIISSPPLLHGVHTLDDIEEGKENAVVLVEALNIGKEHKEEAIAWLKNKDTIILPSDVEAFVESLKDVSDDPTEEPKTA